MPHDTRLNVPLRVDLKKKQLLRVAQELPGIPFCLLANSLEVTWRSHVGQVRVEWL